MIFGRFSKLLAMQKFQRLQSLLVKVIVIQELYKINIISIPKSLQLLRLFELNFFIRVIAVESCLF